MEINLSNEMIEKITRVAFGRKNSLRRKIDEVEAESTINYREEAKKKILLNDLNKALNDATEIHELFLEMMEELGLTEE